MFHPASIDERKETINNHQCLRDIFLDSFVCLTMYGGFEDGLLCASISAIISWHGPPARSHHQTSICDHETNSKPASSYRRTLQCRVLCPYYRTSFRPLVSPPRVLALRTPSDATTPPLLCPNTYRIALTMTHQSSNLREDICKSE